MPSTLPPEGLRHKVSVLVVAEGSSKTSLSIFQASVFRCGQASEWNPEPVCPGSSSAPSPQQLCVLGLATKPLCVSSVVFIQLE